MKKLEMSMQMIIAEVRRVGICSIDSDKVSEAWKLADAMQAEADKREDKTRPAVLSQGGYVEKPKYELAGVVAHGDDWQPDWSQAPDDACCWFIGGSSWDLKAYWSKYIPCYKSETTQTTWQGNGMIEAPSFDYQGDWRDSLRKRHENGFKRYYGDGLECAR